MTEASEHTATSQAPALDPSSQADVPRLEALEQTALLPLREQLVRAAEAFSPDAASLKHILMRMVTDVERGLTEPLELFPVAHHSPSAAVHLIRRLQTAAPKVIYMEGCEDLPHLLPLLRDCRLPVALQAYGPRPVGLPTDAAPLSLVLPLTELSAEMQAITWCLEHPETRLCFVDRSTDHVFQWKKGPDPRPDASEPPPEDASTDPDNTQGLHGHAVGIDVGSLEPTFDQFRQLLLKNARVQHFSEWWEQYVEQAILEADYTTYRQVMFLVGSLIAQLGRRDRDQEEDALRERLMWTRVKQDLRAHGIQPGEALFIQGAAHTASRVEEFGVQSSVEWEIPPRSETQWLYGLIPSSYQAIEHQFSQPPGTMRMAERAFDQTLRRLKLKRFTLRTTAEVEKAAAGGTPATPATPAPKAAKKGKASPSSAAPSSAASASGPTSASAPTSPGGVSLVEGFLARPPGRLEDDEAELLANSVRVVALARDNGYLASTADSIAIYQTAILLARLRNRTWPSPYDFRDAAITCLEKDRVPRKRSIDRVVDILLGGDRIGQVGYASLPPLVQNIYLRLEPLKISVESRTLQRALLDLRANPSLRDCSDLLWMLENLLGREVVRPIMGDRRLGTVAQQESWDIGIGRAQARVIQLGYEGISLEQVLERRLRARAFATHASSVTALEAVEDGLRLLKLPQLTEELGEHAVERLEQEKDLETAKAVFERIRKLIHYYRTTPGGLPPWIRHFVTAGYAHYATLLPTAFTDAGFSPTQITAMLGFLFGLEGLALSLGCSRSQLEIALSLAESGTQDPTKLALLWTAQVVMQKISLQTVRERLEHVLESPLLLGQLPDYLTGLLLSLSFTPLLTRLVVELLSRAFATLPDSTLMPWLPGLLMTLRSQTDEGVPALLKEARSLLPNALDALGTWKAPWENATPPPGRPADSDAANSVEVQGSTRVASKASNTPEVQRTPQAALAFGLLRSHPESLLGLAELLGISSRDFDADAASPLVGDADMQTDAGTDAGTDSTADATERPALPSQNPIVSAVALLLTHFPATLTALQ